MATPASSRPASHLRTGVLVLLAGLLFPLPAEAQLGRLKDKLKQKADERTEEVLDKTVQAADAAVVCVVTDTECAEAAREQGQAVAYTDEEGNPVAAPAAAGPVAEASRAAPGVGAWANFDFVPGERVLFAEDFTRDRVGNFPKRLTFQDGNLEVVEWGGRRWLRANPEGAFEIPLPEVLPEKFTLEFDATIPWNGFSLWGTPWSEDDHTSTAWIDVSGHRIGLTRGGWAGESVTTPGSLIPSIDAQFEEGYLSDPVRIRVMADGGYVKVYLEEHRVSNVPNADFARTNVLTFQFRHNEPAPLITDIVVSASDVTIYDALEADGRVAVQGILFDTGSDRVRPESSGTLAEIAAVMQDHPDLALLIEGHTDGVGDAAANQVLSEKRAAAVKQALVSAYGVSASRLETAGFGATRPAADDSTPEGRQQNRRVELVKR